MNAPLPAFSDTPPSDDAIVIEFTMTRDDLVTFNFEGVGVHPSFLEAARTLKKTKLIFIKFALFLLVTAALWLWAGSASPGFFSWMFSGFFAGLSLACLFVLRILSNSTKPKSVRATAETSVKSGRFSSHIGRQRYIIDHRGVELIATEYRLFTGWSRILGTTSMPSFLSVDFDTTHSALIPRRATDPATLDRLTQFVERMIATKPNSERERTLEALRASDQTCPKCKYPLKDLRDARCPECGLSLNRATLSLPIRGAGEPARSNPPTSREPTTETPSRSR